MRIALLTTDNREHHRLYDGPTPVFGTAPTALLQGFAQLPDLEVHVLSCTQQPLRSPEKLADNLWFHSLHVPKIGWLRTGYQGCIRATRRKLRELQPAIVHGQGTERDCAISAVLSGFPNVITIHGNMRAIARVNRSLPMSFHWIAARLERWTLPRSNGVVCITNYTRTEVAALARQTWVVANAVNRDFYSAVPEKRQPPAILCVGNILPLKNQNALIRALDPLQAQTDFVLLFLGNANRQDPYVKEFFDLLESRPWCRHEGFADQRKLKNFFEQAAMAVLPSLEDNCPMAVLEAMAAGVPVIAAQVGGVPDLIEPERTGLLCNPRDAESMRKAIARLLASPELSLALAREAKQAALRRFDPLVVARQHLEIYKAVLSTCS